MSAAVLNPRAAERLCKLLGYLGSDHVGERAAAALKAHEFVHALGLQWCDVIGISHSAHVSNVPHDWREMARACRERGHHLSPKEFGFVSNMCMARFEPSEKQLAWLTDIYSRVSR